MTAKVLVVDDQLPNVRLLEAKLKAEYFEVITATDGQRALELAVEQQPDVILLDIMMPGIDGYEVCRRLKADRQTRHIPVIMVTALDQPDDRVRGLECGADDFLTKPVDSLTLFARLRSLLRLKTVLDELRLREDSLKLDGLDAEVVPDSVDGAKILVIAGECRIGEHILSKIHQRFHADCECDPALAAGRAAEGYDLILVDLSSHSFDGLRLCARIRSVPDTRQIPILAIVDPDEIGRSVRALDMGVNDLVHRPIDPNELLARICTQLRRKSYADQLRERLEDSLEMAVTDPLTGLFNRRYVSSRLEQVAHMSASDGVPYSVLLADIDHFKRINDTYGHEAGDAVLKSFAERLKMRLRAMDMGARYGGEEFLILMPEASIDEAKAAAERLRMSVAAEPFVIPADGTVMTVTISVGVAEGFPREATTDVVRRADEALYQSKASGRNCVNVAKSGSRAA